MEENRLYEIDGYIIDLCGVLAFYSKKYKRIYKLKEVTSRQNGKSYFYQKSPIETRYFVATKEIRKPAGAKTGQIFKALG